MPLEPRDMARLWDMLDAARAVTFFIEGKRFADLLSDRMLRDAIERNLEILGEAARHVTQSTKDMAGDIPWRQIVGLRNVLAHQYGQIVYERIWRICIEELPPLIVQLAALGVDDPPAEES